MAGLYETDILEWAEQQADLLRRYTAGERSNAAAVDWTNIIEELESVGREQLHAVESLLLQALVHMLKAEAWPVAVDAPTWRADAMNFRAQAANRFTSFMRQRINLTRIYRQALRAVPDVNDGQLPLPLPETCPVTLDGLLADLPEHAPSMVDGGRKARAVQPGPHLEAAQER